MKALLLIHPDFDAVWPFAGDYMAKLLATRDETVAKRLTPADTGPASTYVDRPTEYGRLVCFGVPFTANCLARFSALQELVVPEPPPADTKPLLSDRGVTVVTHLSQGHWGQAVAEFGLALTLRGLRRLPQTHASIVHSHEDWDYSPPGGVGRPGGRGQQFGDDPRFTHGTLSGKRVRIAGAGNIASRYAQWAHMLGADVAMWDPYAPEPAFHRTGARREFHLNRLVEDAEIFAPIIPLTPSTRGLITAGLIDRLPQGCLLLLITRAEICDFASVRRRVLDDELSLAADVFDIEPLPIGDSLLGRHNVVHTPHNAGRTLHSNEQFAETLFAQLRPIDRT